MLFRAERLFDFRIYLILRATGELLDRSERIDIPANISAATVGRDRLRQLVDDPTYELSAEAVEFIIANNHECIGLFADDRLIHYVVQGNGRAPAVDGLMLLIPDDHLYYYKAFTVPDMPLRR